MSGLREWVPEFDGSCRSAREQSGFTLVELLVAISLMALVGGACVAMLNAGIGVWQRAQDYGRHEQQVLIALERFRRDLQRSRSFSLVPFDGRLNRLSFAATEVLADEGPAEIGEMGYFIDYRQQVLCRGFVPYRLERRRRIEEACSPILDNVHRLEFAYLVPEKGDGGLQWSRRWDSPDSPYAVRVSLTLREEGQDVGSFSAIVPMMSAGASDEES